MTKNNISFRQRSNTADIQATDYPQYHDEWVEPIYGFSEPQDRTLVTQELGCISTHEGRLLTFPNTLQHRVSPFSLVDKSKHGHRKALVLYLVDPHIRIISSANVPPQREIWWTERDRVVDIALARFPREIRDMVDEYADNTIDEEEAKRLRVKFLKEKKIMAKEKNGFFQRGIIGVNL